MSRKMSFALTIEQIRDQTKTVTRRIGWWFIKPGDVLQPVVKARGLHRGEQVQRINGPIRIVSTRAEALNAITPDDVVREGYPRWTPEQFIKMFCWQMRCKPDTIVNRIEFEYIDSPTSHTSNSPEAANRDELSSVERAGK